MKNELNEIKATFMWKGEYITKPLMKLNDKEFTLWLATQKKEDAVFYARKFWKAIKEQQEQN